MTTCPTCGQVIATAGRLICGRCGKLILRGHKYTHLGSVVVHRSCGNPELSGKDEKQAELLTTEGIRNAL